MRSIYRLNALALMAIFSHYVANSAFADSNKKRVQEVVFEGSDVDGQTHNPDGAYLVQKRGVKFLPLYKVKDRFDSNIKDSVEYL